MKKNFYLYIIFVPILAVLVSITLITLHNINELNTSADEDIKAFTKNYLIEQKTKIYNRVHFFSNIIKVKTAEFKSEQKVLLKDNVDKIEYYSKHLFHYHNYKKTAIKDKINDEMINHLFKNKHLNIIFDLKNYELLFDGNNLLKDVNLKSLSDITGVTILNKFRKFDRFIQFDLKGKRYLFYAKKTDDSELLILSGDSIDSINEDIKSKILSTNIKNRRLKEYRLKYLNVIKNYGEGFITYDYTKPESKEIFKKLSFFYLQKDWNWIIGTGFYFDDLDFKTEEFKSSIEKKIKRSVNTAIIVGILLIIFISIAIYFITSKLNKIINDYSDNLNKSNESLRKQKDVFKTLFDKSTDGIIIYSEDGYIINCNDSVVRMLEYEDKSFIINKKLQDISPKKQNENDTSILKEKLFQIVSFNNQTYNFEWVFLSKNSRKLFCEIRTTRLILDDNNIVHAIIRDITYKKELEEKNKRQQVMLAEESKKSALGEMLTMIAHQWRQPLNNINLLIHFVRDTFDTGKFSKEEIKNITLDMKAQIDYLSNTINDFTNFTNPKKTTTLFCIKDAIEKTYNLAIAQFEKNNIKVFIESDRIEIQGIENEFMQVILNILNNAKDALLESNNKEKLLFINAKEINNKLVLTIKDTAGGISNKVISRIFDPYFTTKHKRNGTGIGLYMSSQIIKQYKNGAIKASNESFNYNGKFYEGAVFTITLDLD
ncbi:multi-sensor signal transduction histidine kinase [Arcobacter nitrofigilis DSM 7299]|uniref:histidine kinase n=1 Tax=Arcobacter nitrofigilis (strain ATCC 33309 / DSM 7299 / CCUG 15893 / LMG 7604 / NCTC 12251 / CI) TaxID=572480 RepID=D5V4T4_ARCNC|nr:ATP-binding protein [Arcobacter nitrofigilis]ADG92989.1 multi-sensor signal transduction histidine kinase [Arcobacter nitrofigilis DSM 7299]